MLEQISGKQAGEVSEGRLASQPSTVGPGADYSPEKSNLLPTAAVKVRLAGDEVVALCDTGSGGMGVGVSLVEEAVCSQWRRKLGRRITPNMRTLTTVAGQTLNILGEIVVDFVLGGELVQQEMLVVRGMTQQMILGWDFCLAHKAMVDASEGVLWFDGTFAPLLRKEELIPVPSMVRLRERAQIPARSEKVVVAQLQENVHMANGLDILVDPMNVFVNDEGLAIARTVSTVKDGFCAVQVINVTDVELTIEAMVPLGIGYPVKSDAYTECAAVFMYELEHLMSHEVVGEVGVDSEPSLSSHVAGGSSPNIDLSKADLTAEQTGQLQELLTEFGDVFSKDQRDYGRTQLLTHSIKHRWSCPNQENPIQVTSNSHDSSRATNTRNGS